MLYDRVELSRLRYVCILAAGCKLEPIGVASKQCLSLGNLQVTNVAKSHALLLPYQVARL